MKGIVSHIISAVSQKERKRLALLIFLHTIVNLADVFSMVCLLYVVKFYTQPFPVNSGNFFLSQIFPGKNSVLPALALLLLFALKNITGHLVYKMQVKLICRVAVRLSEQNLSDYLEGAHHDYARVDSAVFVSKIIHQPTEFAQHVLQSCQQIITELLLIIFSAAALLIYNAKLFLIVFLTMLPAIMILSWLTKKKLEKIKKNIKAVVEQSLQYLNEALKGYVESNIYNRNSFFVNRHREAQQKVAAYITGIQTTQDIPARFFEVFAVSGLFVLIVTINYAAAVSSADVVMVGAFMAAAYKIIPSIAKIINLNGQIRTYRYTVGGTRRNFTVRQAKTASGKKIEAIEFRDISFSYKGPKLFDGFSCTIRSGSFTGIRGDSGSGKTSLLQLLLGFYTPCSGSILFNGEITDPDTRISNWHHTAYVKQEPFILHASILNNIVLFEPGYKKDRLKEVLEVTGLKELADGYPEGIYKLVTEAGKNLSGGQRKRLAIARALYKEADLILLDEPFSELDESSEFRMLKYLKQLSQRGKMIILISHSPASFQFCDTVINVSSPYQLSAISNQSKPARKQPAIISGKENGTV